MSDKDKELDKSEIILFKLINGKYLTENEFEITTEMLMKNEHNIDFDYGWIRIQSLENQLTHLNNL